MLLAVACAATAVPAAPSATAAPLTAADVRRIALSSEAGTASRFASSNGEQQAKAAGVPVDAAYLAANPEVAAKVPLAAPPGNDGAKYQPYRGGKPLPSALPCAICISRLEGVCKCTHRLGSQLHKRSC